MSLITNLINFQQNQQFDTYEKLVAYLQNTGVGTGDVGKFFGYLTST